LICGDRGGWGILVVAEVVRVGVVVITIAIVRGGCCGWLLPSKWIVVIVVEAVTYGYTWARYGYDICVRVCAYSVLETCIDVQVTRTGLETE